MAANTSPIYTLVPVNATASLTAANTARDGSGTITALVSGHADGTRIERIIFISSQATAAANSAMVGRVFLTLDAASTWVIFDEIQISAVTASNTAVGARNVLTYPNGLFLSTTSQRLGCTISVRAGVQDNTIVIAQGGNYAA